MAGEFDASYAASQAERNALMARIRTLVPRSVRDALDSGIAPPSPQGGGTEEEAEGRGALFKPYDDTGEEGDSRGWLANLIIAASPLKPRVAAATATLVARTDDDEGDSHDSGEEEEASAGEDGQASPPRTLSRSPDSAVRFAISPRSPVLPPPTAQSYVTESATLELAHIDDVWEAQSDVALRPHAALPGRHRVSDELAAALAADCARGTVGAVDTSAISTARLTAAAARAAEAGVGEMNSRTLHLIGSAGGVLQMRHALLSGDWEKVAAAVAVLDALTLGVAVEARAEHTLVAAECEDRAIERILGGALREGCINGDVGAIDADAVEVDPLTAALAKAGAMKCHSERAHRTVRSAEIVLEIRRLVAARDTDSLCSAVRRLPPSILTDVSSTARDELRVVLREVDDLRLQGVLLREIQTSRATGRVGAVDVSQCEAGLARLEEAVLLVQSVRVRAPTADEAAQTASAPPGLSRGGLAKAGAGTPKIIASATTLQLLATAQLLAKLRAAAGKGDWRPQTSLLLHIDSIAPEGRDEVMLLQREAAHWKATLELSRCLAAEKRDFKRLGLKSVAHCETVAMRVAVTAAEQLGVLGTVRGQQTLRAARALLGLRSALLADDAELTDVAIRNAEIVAAQGAHALFSARTCVWALETALANAAAQGEIGALDLTACSPDSLATAMSNAIAWGVEADDDVARLLRSAALVLALRRAVCRDESSVALQQLQRAADDARSAGVVRAAVHEVALLLGEASHRAATSRLRAALHSVPSTFSALGDAAAVGDEADDFLLDAVRNAEKLSVASRSNAAQRLVGAAKNMIELRAAIRRGDDAAIAATVTALRVDPNEAAAHDALPPSARAKVQSIDTVLRRAAALSGLRRAMSTGGARASALDPETLNCEDLETEALARELAEAESAAAGSPSSRELLLLMKAARGLLAVRRALETLNSSVPYGDGLSPAWRAVGSALIEAHASGIGESKELLAANMELLCVRRTVESRTVVHVVLKLLRRCAVDAEVLANAPSYADFEGEGVPIPHSVPGLVGALAQARAIDCEHSSRAAALVRAGTLVAEAFEAMAKCEFPEAQLLVDEIGAACEVPIVEHVQRILDGCTPTVALLRALARGRARGETLEAIDLSELDVESLGLCVSANAAKAALGTERARALLRTARMLLALRTLAAQTTLAAVELDELFEAYNAETSNRFAQPRGAILPLDLDCLAAEGAEECRLLILFLLERRAVTALEGALESGRPRGTVEGIDAANIEVASLTVAVVLGRNGCRTAAATRLLASGEVILALRKALTSGPPDFWRSTAVVLLAIEAPLHPRMRAEVRFASSARCLSAPTNLSKYPRLDSSPASHSAHNPQIIFARNCLLHAVLSGCLRAVLPTGVKLSGGLHAYQRYNELRSAVALAEALQRPGDTWGEEAPLPPAVSSLLTLSRSALDAPQGGAVASVREPTPFAVSPLNEANRRGAGAPINTARVLRCLRELGRESVLALGVDQILLRLAVVLRVDAATIGEFKHVVTTFMDVSTSFAELPPTSPVRRFVAA